ncbi:MAG: CoA-transferase subunit beta [Actinobacteria bacterium]|nr:MAG: CoA-transferase subunit beta [Actinomycetota bacterium]
MRWTADEMMTVAAARALVGRTSCFVGIGLPSTAANLAKRTACPDLALIYESGTIGARPTRLPLSIGDGELAETADAVVSVPEVFNYWLQPGRVDVGFLSAAQLDRYARINTTLIGPDYRHPKVRLPGAGGAPEIAASCREVILVVRQNPRTFVDRVDFVTSVAAGAWVITDLGELAPDPDTGELVLTRLHPGVCVPDARAATGWDLRVAATVARTEPPTGTELSALRELLAAS